MRPSRVLTVLSALGLHGLALMAPQPAAAVSIPPTAARADEGTWDLVFEKGNRRCRLFLRAEPRAAGFALAMPAGCHRAFPTLAKATTWIPGDGDRLVIAADDGSPIFAFGPNGTASLTATVGENGDVYALTPINPARQQALAAGPPPAAAVPAEAAKPGTGGGVLVEGAAPKGMRSKPVLEAPPLKLPPTTVEGVAGNYAVLRQDRDTGCMVTLEATGGAMAGFMKARLAPACRDQGIVIFEPAGWRLFHGDELVLSAKKGHTTSLRRRDEKTWANAPAAGRPLVLKRL